MSLEDLYCFFCEVQRMITFPHPPFLYALSSSKGGVATIHRFPILLLFRLFDRLARTRLVWLDVRSQQAVPARSRLSQFSSFPFRPTCECERDIH